MHEDVSRRQVAAWGAASLLLWPRAARGQVIPPGAPVPEALAHPPDGTPATTNGQKLLTVGVRINGKGPFQFVVDTGADRSVIAEDVAASLALPRGPKVLVEGVVRTIPAGTVSVAQLDFGAATCQDLTIPMLPRSQLLADGYLGLDSIDGYRVMLDFKEGRLVVSQPRPTLLLVQLGPKDVRVSVSGEYGHLRAFNCYVDGIHTMAFIDSGAEVSVGNAQLYDALAANDPSYVKKDTVELTGVTGGVVVGRLTTLKEVKLGSLSFLGCDVAIADLQIFDIWRLAGQPALLIGMNWLRKFSRVSIDYGRKELLFHLANIPSVRRA